MFIRAPLLSAPRRLFSVCRRAWLPPARRRPRLLPSRRLPRGRACANDTPGDASDADELADDEAPRREAA